METFIAEQGSPQKQTTLIVENQGGPFVVTPLRQLEENLISLQRGLNTGTFKRIDDTDESIYLPTSRWNMTVTATANSATSMFSIRVRHGDSRQMVATKVSAVPITTHHWTFMQIVMIADIRLAMGGVIVFPQTDPIRDQSLRTLCLDLANLQTKMSPLVQRGFGITFAR